VVRGIEAILQWLELPRCVIAIEENKPEAIALMKEKTAHLPKVSVQTLPATYPQGAEKVIIQSVTGRELPRGALPADVGVIVDNVTTVSVLGRFLRTGMPLTTKRLTVAGDAFDRPRNVEVPIGTLIGDVISYCQPVAEPRKIITGGPMMGVSQMDVNYPITRQNNGLLVFGQDQASLLTPGPCIRCARCIHACPAGLSPVDIHDAYYNFDVDSILELDADLCMGCGSCSYICPAKRPLTQAATLARDLLKERGLKKNG
jgi:electron transport complex protein RnfC